MKDQSITNSDLFTAIRTQNINNIIMLLDMGANVNAKDEYGDTPLHIATFLKDEIPSVPISLRIVEKLIQAGANVNAQDAYLDTPLHNAVGQLNMKIVEFLMSIENIDLSLKNHDEMTALHVAERKYTLETEKSKADLGHANCTSLEMAVLSIIINFIKKGKPTIAEPDWKSAGLSLLPQWSEYEVIHKNDGTIDKRYR